MEGILREVHRPLILTVILIVSILYAQPVLLTDSLSTDSGDFALLSRGGVVFVNTTGTLSYVNYDDPFNISEFSIDWVPSDNGWADRGEFLMLKSSPDGNQLAIAFKVQMPDSLPVEGVSTPDPIAILVCNADGGNPRLVGIISDSEYQLSFDFTQDSRLLYGARFLNCLPDPESYFALQLGDQSSSLRPFDVVDLEEGARFSANGIIKQYFIGNPWSDLIAAGDEPLNEIADMVSFSAVYEDSALTSPIIQQWITPDAGLAWRDSTQIVRFSDGAVYENPGEPFTILCSLSDGSFVYTTDQGTTLNRGTINLETFEVEQSEELSDLYGYFTPTQKTVPVTETTAMVFSAGRGLYYYELP